MMTTASASTLATLMVWRANAVHQRAGRAVACIGCGMNVMAQSCPVTEQRFVPPRWKWREACQRLLAARDEG